jgi:hypothetical protein
LREKYIEEIYGIPVLSNKAAWEKHLFWKRVAAAEENIGKALEQGYDRDEFLKLFSELKISQIGTFYSQKCNIQRYFKWLKESDANVNKINEEIKARNESNIEILKQVKFEEMEIDETVKGTYFKDFDSLQKEIDRTVINADKPDDAVHDTAISLIYMAWYGVTIEEVCEMQKTDLNNTDCTVYIAGRNQSIKVSRKVMDFFIEYRDATDYLTKAAADIRMPYKESSYLMRSAKLPSLKVVGVKNILSRFTKYCFDNVKFMYSRIRWSGIFNRVYADEVVNGALVKNDYDKIAEVFGETYKSSQDASDRLREYKNWKSLFYKSE